MFLGAGSAFTVGSDNFHSNVLIKAPSGRRLLVDCGSDLRWSLERRGLTHVDVTDIYVSHLHADHVGGLEYVGLTTRFDPRCERPRLYLADGLVGDLWDHSLSGGMRAVTGEDATLDFYFDVRGIPPGGGFDWEGLHFDLVPTTHVTGKNGDVHSYGLDFTANGRRVFYTTDTQFTPAAFGDLLEGADLIFHDCETAPTASGVHAHFAELLSLPAHVKAKTWLYHYQPGPLPDARGAGFLGFVTPGQTFEL